MTLVLDARQRAMLAEMGLRIWGAESAPSQAAVLAAAPSQGAGAAAATRPEVPHAAAAEEAALPAKRDAQPRAGSPVAVPTPPPPDGVALAPEHPAGHSGDGADGSASWQLLREEVVGCTACSLCEGRRNPVPGAGDLKADMLVVGEGPGESEDLLGTPFAGQEGILLDNMLRALGRDRLQGIYLTHALKCRAPANRSPEPAEVARCEAHLRREVELLRPSVILALGRLAVQALLPGGEPVGKLRGRVHEYRGVPVVVSYAPGYLLRNLPEKARAWADLCLAQEVVAQQGPAKLR